MEEYVVSWESIDIGHELGWTVRTAITAKSEDHARKKFLSSFPEREGTIIKISEGKPEEYARYEKANTWY